LEEGRSLSGHRGIVTERQTSAIHPHVRYGISLLARIRRERHLIPIDTTIGIAGAIIIPD
jgi:hypothetical protein